MNLGWCASVVCSTFRNSLIFLSWTFFTKANIVLYFEEFIFLSSWLASFTLSLCILVAGGSCAAPNVTLSIFSDLWPRRKSLTSAVALGAGQKPTSCLSVRVAVCHGKLGAANGDPQWWDDSLCPASCQRWVFSGTPESHSVLQPLERNVPFLRVSPQLCPPAYMPQLTQQQNFMRSLTKRELFKRKCHWGRPA